MHEEKKQQLIKALLRERRMLLAVGKDDKVPAVDAELSRLGHEGESPARRAAKRPRKSAEER